MSESTAQAEGPLLIHVDGACRGNPGEAGFGIHIVDASGATTDLYGYLGRATNNVAEYQALLHALRHALGRNARRIDVRSDSELMVRQLSGSYGVKNSGLRPLHREALDLLRRFESATIRHVPREENREADRLANRALDLRSSSPA